MPEPLPPPSAGIPSQYQSSISPSPSGIASPSFWEFTNNASATLLVVGGFLASIVILVFKLGRTASRVETKIDSIDKQTENTAAEIIKLSQRVDELAADQKATEERTMCYLREHRRETDSGFTASQSQINDLRGMFNRLIRALREHQILTKDQFDPRERNEL